MIELSGIRVVFNPGTALENVALRGVDLTIPQGQFLTVIGSNGAGKSTTLNVIAGLVRPLAGCVAIDGTDVTNWPVHARARLVSRIFQDPKMGTCEDFSILENYALARARTAPRGLRMAIGAGLREEAVERLKVLDLGLENRLDDKVGLLSGGQRQAMSLVMATAGETRILLLDEHTAALDPKTAHFVMELSRRLVGELRLTVMMVTHSMAHALDYGDRTIMLHRGRVLLDLSGEARDQMTVDGLIAHFKNDGIADDALLLG